MDSLSVALIMSQRAKGHGAGSALPDAPVVPYVEKAAAVRTRQTLAGALRQLADVVAPTLPASNPGR
ncbi:MAG: hypothetical protein M3Y44_12250 [Actinomycetota bacterium]|nr:hypothetical protein [Actinomycetota bacterium]